MAEIVSAAAATAAAYKSQRRQYLSMSRTILPGEPSGEMRINSLPASPPLARRQVISLPPEPLRRATCEEKVINIKQVEEASLPPSPLRILSQIVGIIFIYQVGERENTHTHSSSLQTHATVNSKQSIKGRDDNPTSNFLSLQKTPQQLHNSSSL